MKGLKKICIITSSRSEYGLLKWLMYEIKKDPEMQLQLVVTGSHLSKNFGYTINEIIDDGFLVDDTVDMHLEKTNPVEIAQSMGYCMIGLSKVFEKLSPDIIVILGDRYELLSIAGTSLVMNIPIAHISGGDLTEGAIDDQIRHAVSKMASLHFPGNQESADRLIRMGENPDSVYNVGEPGLDSFLYLNLLSKSELSKLLPLSENLKWVLFTYHPETKIPTQDNLKRVICILDVLLSYCEFQVVVTKSNADNGGHQINELLSNYAKKHPHNILFCDSLGQLVYLSLMKSAFFMIGNSSSAVVEAPVIPLPAINIGERQSGRFFCSNILQSDGSPEDLKSRIDYINRMSGSFLKNIKSPYGEGGTATKIKSILKSRDMSKYLKKGYYDPK